MTWERRLIVFLAAEAVIFAAAWIFGRSNDFEAALFIIGGFSTAAGAFTMVTRSSRLSRGLSPGALLNPILRMAEREASTVLPPERPERVPRIQAQTFNLGTPLMIFVAGIVAIAVSPLFNA